MLVKVVKVSFSVVEIAVTIDSPCGVVVTSVLGTVSVVTGKVVATNDVRLMGDGGVDRKLASFGEIKSVGWVISLDKMVSLDVGETDTVSLGEIIISDDVGVVITVGVIETVSFGDKISVAVTVSFCDIVSVGVGDVVTVSFCKTV